MYHRYAHETGAEVPERQPNEKAKQATSWPILTQHHAHVCNTVHMEAHGPVNQGSQNEKAM